MRLSIALLTILTTVAASTEATACGLTDWLFGRQPQVVGYTPVAVGTAPVATTPYAVGYAPVTTSLVTTPAASTSVLRPAVTAPAPVQVNGAYQAQRPAYFENPSVYTGLPVAGTAQTVFRSPTTYRGSTTGSYGASNQYPNTYVSGYTAAQVVAPVNPAAPGLPRQVTTPTGSPATQIPATQVAPIFATPQPSGGLSRFFGSIFGTNYQTTYYRAPITYYRPVTTVDPVTGATITVQQPCTSSVQQLQRTPVQALQVPQTTTVQPGATFPSAPTVTYGPSNGCDSPTFGAPSTFAPTGGIGQASAIGSAPGATVPIPSTTPGGSPFAQPGLAPLTGAPPTTTMPSSSAPAPSIQPGLSQPGSMPPAGSFTPGSIPPATSSGGGDLAPVEQPRLETYRPQEQAPSETNSNGDASNQPPNSYWKMQAAEDSTAMIRPRGSVSRQDPISLSRSSSSGLQPIQAPDDYVSPFGQRRLGTPAAPVNTERFEPPPLPERSKLTPNDDGSDMTSVSVRTRVETREAVLTRSTPRTEPKSQKTVWYTIQP